MGKYSNFLKFYQTNSDKLLFGKDSLRPAKSITRRIFNIDKFIKYFIDNGKTCYSDNEVASSILNLDKPKTSTTSDNIRNMVELKFLYHDKRVCHLTQNFIDFIKSGESVKEYVLAKLNNISNIGDISMFLNCLLCLLREGLLYGEIISYPDSYVKFQKAVPLRSDRKNHCERVYKIYGFHGSQDSAFGDYTPNANYRFISTANDLGLIRANGTTQEGFKRYTISDIGFEVLKNIDRNIVDYNNSLEEINLARETNSVIDDSKFKDALDESYIQETNNTEPDDVLSDIDLPEVLSNNFNEGNSIKRNAKKAANAKKRANYRCEYDTNHKSFISTNGNYYCEAHHLIPMSEQNRFFYSLDVEANIVCLCSTCHAKLHHSDEKEKIDIITKLYNKRKERLKKCNLSISLDELISIYTKG